MFSPDAMLFAGRPYGHVEGRARGPICLSKFSPLDRESPVSLVEK
jgi:hypothetical protein